MPTTPVCVIDETGIHQPDFAACLTYFQMAYRNIYGQDIYLGNDSQDGQFLSLVALALHESNGTTVAAYNAFSPLTAQGNGLSSVVKINGIRRKVATYSTCDLLIVGQANAGIINGVARDLNGVAWALPATVVIPPSGQILLTATCLTIGAIAAAAGTITDIATPTLGWQSVTNPSAATPGQPVETDSALRQRQALSTALPAQTLLGSLVGALLAISGVNAVQAYENDTRVQDANGLPGNCISLVVDGGDAATIAQVIAAKKGPANTYGDVIKSVSDAVGIPHRIAFFRPTLVPVAWYLTVRAKRGYTADVEGAIQAALAAYVNSLAIGEDLQISSAYPAAVLAGDVRAGTFELLGGTLRAQRADMSSDQYGDINCRFNERLTCSPSDVIITAV